MRGVLSDRQESTRVGSAGNEGKRLAKPTIRIVGALAGRQGSEVVDRHSEHERT
jgi:hypothetical protein